MYQVCRSSDNVQTHHFPLYMHLAGSSCNHNSLYCQIFPNLIWHGPSGKGWCSCYVQLDFSHHWKPKVFFSKYENYSLHLLGFYITQRPFKWFYLNQGCDISVLKAKVREAGGHLTTEGEGGRAGGCSQALQGPLPPGSPWLLSLLAAFQVGRC